MRSLLLISVLLLGGCYIPPSKPTPEPSKPEPTVRDDWKFSESVPAAMEGKGELASRLSAVMAELSKQIEHDGKQPEPKILTSTDIAIIFDRIVEYGFTGQGAYTQGVSDAVTKALEQFEPDGESRDLEPKDRAKAVKMFEALSQALQGVK
jgi:hypothetical protein